MTKSEWDKWEYELACGHIETINEFNEIEIKSLIIELMGKHSNIILINDKNIIIDSFCD